MTAQRESKPPGQVAPARSAVLRHPQSPCEAPFRRDRFLERNDPRRPAELLPQRLFRDNVQPGVAVHVAPNLPHRDVFAAHQQRGEGVWMGDGADGVEGRGVGVGFGRGDRDGGAGAAFLVVGGAGGRDGRGWARVQRVGDLGGGEGEEGGERFVRGEDGDAGAEGVEKGKMQVGGDEVAKGQETGGFVFGDSGHERFVELGQGSGLVEREGVGFGVDGEGVGGDRVEDRSHGLQLPGLERLAQRAVDAALFAREEARPEPLVPGELRILASAKIREQVIVVNGHGENQPIGQNARSHGPPRHPSKEFRLEGLLHRLPLQGLVQRIIHRLRPAQDHRLEPLRPPGPPPHKQQLRLGRSGGPVFARCPRIVEGVNGRSRPQRREHRARLVLRDGERERVVPFPVAIPFRVAAGAVGLRRRLVSGRAERGEFGDRGGGHRRRGQQQEDEQHGDADCDELEGPPGGRLFPGIGCGQGGSAISGGSHS